MKKTILALLICAPAMSAMAAEPTISTDAGTATVYGTVQASFDSAKEQHSDSVDGMTTRGTEVGLTGTINAGLALDVSYDVAVEFNEDNVLELTDANVTFATQSVDVTVGRADSSYDNITRDMDVFDGQFTDGEYGEGQYRLGDSVRSSNRVSVMARPVAGLSIAMDVAAEADVDGYSESEASFGDVYSIGARYELGGATVAAGYERQDSEGVSYEDDQGNVVVDGAIDSTQWKVGLGYDFATAGVDGLTAGVTYNSSKDENSDVTEETVSLTAGYDVTRDITLMGGYARLSSDEVTGGIDGDLFVTRIAADYRLTDSVTASAGLAHNEIEGSNNEFIQTVGVKYTF